MLFYLFYIFQKDILSGLEILVIELTINIYMYIYREEEFSECVGKTDPKAGKKAQSDINRHPLRPATLRTFNRFYS